MALRMAFFPMLILLSVYCMFNVYGLQVPKSPCPNIFQYMQDKNGDYYGQITFPYTDGARFNISVGLAAWMPGFYPEIINKHIKITMLTPYEDLIKNTTSVIAYHVDFPFKNVIPLISLIGLNDRTYCTGPVVPPNDGTVEFTTCGQTHHIQFQSICEDNQTANKENTFGLSSYKDAKQNNQANLDSSVIKHYQPTSQDQYVDIPPSATNNQQPSQIQYIDYPPYNFDKPKQSAQPVYSDFTVNIGGRKPSYKTQSLDFSGSGRYNHQPSQTQYIDYPPYNSKKPKPSAQLVDSDFTVNIGGRKPSYKKFSAFQYR